MSTYAGQVHNAPGNQRVAATMPAPQQHVVYIEGQNGGEYGVSSDGASSKLVGIAERSVRMGFIRKVYSILCLQLLFTFGLCAVFALSNSAGDWVRDRPALVWVALLVAFGFVCAIICVERVARRHPTNIIVLSLFTMFEGFAVGGISAFYETDSVLIALGFTVVITLGLTLFAWQTKIDFTMKSGCIFSLVLLMFMTLIMAIILQSEVLSVIYAALGTVVFSLFLVYDTQLIVGGRHRRFQFSVDDYVFAALALYLDIINLFLFILRLVGGRRD
eukprot:CAMPEP_0196781620 /NCGR_PEP_ID=MMETSP1104-20130614/9979_1 /TAXON_ID=33652 /ORGANISM="Cafeteria sp., Strain Caron Lab Isolate" /LENGTH=274 /DNA_ID=CAMNT_0042151853 /DNA_START=98 /DNA_END=922 /DNA_ORIENTATION=+